jgi:hypothetical protein
MPYKEGQPTLMVFLGIIPVAKVHKKRPFGKPYIRFYDFLYVLSFMYECGAILGRARRDRLSILVKMLVSPGRESEMMEFLRDEPQKRLDAFRDETGKEPDTFFHFILFKELNQSLGLRPNDSFATFKNELVKACDEKVPAGIELDVDVWGSQGIGFGSSFPELTERMYRNGHERIGMDVWSKARAHGLAIPEKPTVLSLEEQEQTVLQMVAVYASIYYPELLAPLDLQLT